MRDKEYRDGYVRSQITMTLPFQIRALRRARGWTQEHLAALTGMAQSRFPSLERPTGKMPDLDTLCRIAAAYDIGLQVRFLPFSELVEWAEAFDPDGFDVCAFEAEFGNQSGSNDSGQSLGGHLQTADIVDIQLYQRQRDDAQRLNSIPAPEERGAILSFPRGIEDSTTRRQTISGQTLNEGDLLLWKSLA